MVMVHDFYFLNNQVHQVLDVTFNQGQCFQETWIAIEA